MKKIASFIFIILLSIILASCNNKGIQFNKEVLHNKEFHNLKIDTIKTNLFFEKLPDNKLLTFYSQYKKGHPLNLNDFNFKIETSYDFSKYEIKQQKVIFVNRVEKEKNYFYMLTPTLHLGTIVTFISKENNAKVMTYLYDNVLDRVISKDFLKPIIFSNKILDVYTLTEEDNKEGVYINGFRYGFRYADCSDVSDKINQNNNLLDLFKDKELKGTFHYDYLQKMDKVDKENNVVEHLVKDFFKDYDLLFSGHFIKEVNNELHIINKYYFKLKNAPIPNNNLNFLLINTNLNQVYFVLFK